MFARILALVFVLLSPLAFAEGDAYLGHWEGAVTLPGPQELELILDLARDGETWSGELDIPAQGARDIPLTVKLLDGGLISMRLQGIPGEPTITGKLDESGVFKGTFAQAGAVYPVELSSGDDPIEAAREALAELGPTVEAQLADWHAAGMAVAVVVDGEVAIAEGYGLRDVENEKPVTADTLFAIGSVTKSFTTFLLARLAEEGAFDWDDPVAELLPGFEMYDGYATQHLTPRDMVSHRSGLPRHDMIWYGDETTTRAEFVEKLRWLEPNRELREAWQYNNLMYLTSGYLAERLTGKSWEAALREQVLDPLGMRRTNFDTDVSQQDADHAIPYIANDDSIQRLEFRPLRSAGPAGSINSSVNEMADWVRTHLGEGELLSPAALAELHVPQMVIPGVPVEPHVSPGAYAMGWFVDTWRGHLRVNHGGNIDGFSALVTFFPRDGVGVVALTNQGGSPLPGLITAWSADRLLGLEPRPWLEEAAKRRVAGKALAGAAEADKERFRIEGTKPSRTLDAFAGLYAHPGYGEIEITRDGKRLLAHYGTLKLPLEHWHYDIWNAVDLDDEDSEAVPEDLRFSFVGDAAGAVRTLHVPFEPFVDPIRFTRQPGRKMRDPAYLATLAGRYALGPQVFTVRLAGDALSLDLPGGVSMKLTAIDDDVFELEGLAGYTARIEGDTMLFVQPDGVYTAERVTEEE